MGPDGHLLGDLGQLSLGLTLNLDVREHPGIPVVAAAELAVAKRVLSIRHVDRAEPDGVHHADRFSVLTVADLVITAAAHEIVAKRVERKQDANPPLGVGVQDDYVAVLLGSHVHAHRVTKLETLVAVEPKLNGLVLDDRQRRRVRDRQARHQQC